MRQGRQRAVVRELRVALELDDASVAHLGVYADGLGAGTGQYSGIRHVRTRDDVLGRDEVRDQLVAHIRGTTADDSRSCSGSSNNELYNSSF